MTHLIEMSRMSANYIVGKTSKCAEKSLFAHFQILLEIGTEIYVFNISDISHLMKFIALVLICGFFYDSLNIVNNLLPRFKMKNLSKPS